jgi:hypothetical protein
MDVFPEAQNKMAKYGKPPIPPACTGIPFPVISFDHFHFSLDLL